MIAPRIIFLLVIAGGIFLYFSAKSNNHSTAQHPTVSHVFTTSSHAQVNKPPQDYISNPWDAKTASAFQPGKVNQQSFSADRNYRMHQYNNVPFYNAHAVSQVNHAQQSSYDAMNQDPATFQGIHQPREQQRLQSLINEQLPAAMAVNNPHPQAIDASKYSFGALDRLHQSLFSRQVNGPMMNPLRTTMRSSLWKPFLRAGHDFVRTAWFSEEGGYSESLRYPIASVSCSGRYCDDVRLGYVKDRNFPNPVSSSGSWTQWFSEETNSMISCSSDKLVARVQCSGRYCDDMRLECRTIGGSFRLDSSDVHTTSSFSEENGEKFCNDGYYLKGMQCSGRYCDNLALSCVRVEYMGDSGDWVPLSRTYQTAVRSPRFSEEAGGTSFPMAGPTAGIQCYSSYCDKIELITVQRNAEVALESVSEWTGWFSEESSGSGSCTNGRVMKELKCKGRYCDDMKLGCAYVKSGYAVDDGRSYETSWISDENGAGYCADGFYVYKISCSGRYCDELKLTCRPVYYDETVTGEKESFPMVTETDYDGDAYYTGGDVETFITWASRDWMGRFSDATSLHRMTIPGTHDTGAIKGSISCTCQSLTIPEQLASGIRFFDIRLKQKSGVLKVYHGSCNMDKTFRSVVEEVVAFLRDHPTETLIMRIKDEDKKTPTHDSAFYNAWLDVYNDYSSWFMGTLSSIPTIGQCRRKILVFSNQADISIGIKWGNSLMEIQDYYNVFWLASDFDLSGGQKCSLPQKKELVKQYMTKAKTSTKLVLNHVSGNTAMLPNDVARSLNPNVYEHLAGNSRAILGITIMDYPGAVLIYRLLRSNF